MRDKEWVRLESLTRPRSRTDTLKKWALNRWELRRASLPCPRTLRMKTMWARLTLPPVPLSESARRGGTCCALLGITLFPKHGNGSKLSVREPPAARDLG